MVRTSEPAFSQLIHCFSVDFGDGAPARAYIGQIPTRRNAEALGGLFRLAATVRWRCADNLRVPSAISHDFLGLSLSREVRIEAQPARTSRDLSGTIEINWAPEGKTVLPTFRGTLIVRLDIENDRSSIELDGTYVPPLDGAGHIFDRAIGHRIAQSTAREFLKDLRQAVEAC